jgi:hypothetical protein
MVVLKVLRSVNMAADEMGRSCSVSCSASEASQKLVAGKARVDSCSFDAPPGCRFAPPWVHWLV